MRDFEPLLASPFGAALAVLLGLLWGSFANVCIHRWPPTEQYPQGRSVIAPGSRCAHCETPIRWYDNIPVVSYLWLLGRCRSCKSKFSARYLLIELLTATLFGIAWWFTLGPGGHYDTINGRAIRFLIDVAFIFLIVVIIFIDIDHMLILHKVTLPSIVIAYVASLSQYRWWEGLLGMAIGYGVPALIREVYFRVRGYEGLGGGDAMLLAVIGALLGWKGVAISLFAGSVLGTIVGGVSLLIGRRDVLKSEIPFGPYLGTAAIFYLFAEPWIVVHFRLFA